MSAAPLAITTAATLLPLPTAHADQRAGKYLIFQLGAEEFGISVMQVKEIMKMQEITPVPQTSHYLQGVINLRGRIVPVVNLRRKFSLPDAESTERTCIVVVRAVLGSGGGAEQPMGLIVDAVQEVLMLGAADIEDAPDFGREVLSDYVRGMATCKGKVKILLDIDVVLNGERHGLQLVDGMSS